jgi:nucleoside phosphorylase
VASQIISYEPQRVGTDSTIYRGGIPTSDTTLSNRFVNAQKWSFKRPDNSRSAIIVGPLLSGEKVIDNAQYKAELFCQFPQAIGGEMEGAGLWAAAARLRKPWILIKAICDWADGKKGDNYQPLAAAAAASLVHNVLCQKDVLNGI